MHQETNLKKGSEIITPNLTFSTTVAPIFQLGYIPRFIGVEKNKTLIGLATSVLWDAQIDFPSNLPSKCISVLLSPAENEL